MSRHGILILLSSGDIGGGESVTLDQVARLRDVPGFEATLGAPDGGWVARQARSRGIDFWPIRFDGPSFLASYRIRRKLASGRYDLVHTHLNAASRLGTRAARKARLPCVATLHGLNRARYYERADRIIAVSEAGARHLAAQLPASRCPPILVMPNQAAPGLAPDPSGADKVRQELGLPDAAIVLAVVGKLYHVKGQQLAIDIAARLPEDHHLLLVGAGPDRQGLEAQVAQVGLAERVHFLGRREDMAALYALADVVLVTSIKESSPLVVAEALQCGTRVVGAHTGGIPETLGGLGQIVEGRDPADWARAVERSLASHAPPPRAPDHVDGQPREPILRLYEELLGSAQ